MSATWKSYQGRRTAKRNLNKGRRGRAGTRVRGLLIALLGLDLVAAPAVGQETPGGGIQVMLSF